MLRNTNFAVVVPCYNEERVISVFEKELDDFYNYLSKNHQELEVRFVIVDNNSTDRSKEYLDLLASRHAGKVSVISCSTQGYGAALKMGFNEVKNFKYISFLDLDDTYPMLDLFKMYSLIEKMNYDIVYGARLHTTSEIGFVRKLGNSFYVSLLKFLFKSSLTDACSGMRMFKSEKIDEVLNLSDNGLSFSIQFTSYVLVKKWKLNEIPINYRNRVGESKLSVFFDGFNFLFSLLKVYLFDKRGY